MINTAQVTPSYAEYLREGERRGLKRRFSNRQRLHPIGTVARVAASGMGRGFEQKSRLSGEWDISGSCQASRPVVMLGAKAKLRGEHHVRAGGGTFELVMHTRCRQCADCLRRRRNLWAYRGQVEIGEAVRTWFATFTLSPHNHSIMHMRASARLARGGTVLDRLPAAEQAYEVASEYQKELTLYFKRLRKNTGAVLRYLLVGERHKSGHLHYHALIHEVSAVTPVRHADLTATWNLGFTKFKLVSNVKAAWYVAKYLAKDAATRIRASIRYGSRVTARVKTLFKASGTTCPRETPPPSKGHKDPLEQPNKYPTVCQPDTWDDVWRLAYALRSTPRSANELRSVRPPRPAT